ncbi:MAG: PTS sugar transporter subunit IIA [Candidatus Aminicenantales bacterium]
MKIHSLLSEGVIILELVSQDRDAVLKEIVEQLKGSGKVAGHKDLYDKLIQRERLGSTAIGNGIAIPHCKLKETESPVVALAVSRKGVRFEALDGKPTHIFFLVISSPDNPGQNLHILAAVANLVRKSGSLQKRILGAKTPGKILEIIREEEERIHE